MAKVYIFLARGFEEVEALTTVDLLRRAGVEVVMTATGKDKLVTGANGIAVATDAFLDEVDTEDGDMLILPGGQPGTAHLAACKPLADILTAWDDRGRRLAAICAAPTVYGGLGILDGKKATCYPGCEDGLGKAEAVPDRVITDGNVTTSRGVGTAIPFALELISILVDQKTADEIRKGIVYGHR